MEPETTEGQVASTDPAGTTDAAPGGEGGQSIGLDQTTSDGPDNKATGESFFDPESIKHSPELMSAYKGMQGTFSKKMAGISESQNKIDLYDQALRDPMGTVRQLAAQYGMTVVDGQPVQTGEETFNPGSWEDVVNHVRTQVQAEMTDQYSPLVNEVKNLKQQNVEQYLDGKYDDWRTYESDMIGVLQSHPTMANDPDTLYRMSVPSELLESRATERALKRLKGGTDAGHVSGAHRATQTTSGKPTGSLSFDDAVKYAKDQLRSKGFTAPVGG